MFCSKRRVSGSTAETRGPRARIRRQTRALTPPGSRGCWGVTHCSTASRSNRTQASQNDAPIWKRRREDPRRPASLNLRDPTRGPGGRLNDLSWMREWPRSHCCHFLIGDGSRTRPATNVQIFFPRSSGNFSQVSTSHIFFPLRGSPSALHRSSSSTLYASIDAKPLPPLPPHFAKT